MFDPEKLLGGLLRSGTRRSSKGMGSLMKGGMALGLVGIAWEAVEHFMNKNQTMGAQSASPPMPPATMGQTRTGGPPPPPPPGAPSREPFAPSMPPGMSHGPGGPQNVTDASQRRSEALLLIQAMAAAANADGTIDEAERKNILNKLKSVQLSQEELQFIAGELLDPRDIDSLVAQVTSPEVARQVYMASVLAIEVDSDEELDYLQRLAQRLNLDRSVVQGIHEQLGLAIYFG